MEKIVSAEKKFQSNSQQELWSLIKLTLYMGLILAGLLSIKSEQLGLYLLSGCSCSVLGLYCLGRVLQGILAEQKQLLETMFWLGNKILLLLIVLRILATADLAEGLACLAGLALFIFSALLHIIGAGRLIRQA